MGEIESALSSYAGIVQSVVLAKDHLDQNGTKTGNKYLVGYYISNQKLNEDEIINYLSSKLPDYMVPHMLVQMDRFPLTINGKLDTKALPEPQFKSKQNCVAPRNEIESKMCSIWAEGLGLPSDNVGISSDFFKLGGDSIIAIMVVNKIKNILNLNVTVKDIFTYRTVAAVCDKVRNEICKIINNIKRENGILVGHFNLLPIQQWFFNINWFNNNHFNQSVLVRTPTLNVDILLNSLWKLFDFHDCLRLKFMNDLKLKMVVNYYSLDDFNCIGIKSLNVETLNSIEELATKLTDCQQSFSIETGPLLSVTYIYGYKDHSARIHLAFHHLIVDSVSLRILVEDLRDLYNRKSIGLKGTSYRQWVNCIHEYGSKHKGEIDFGRNCKQKLRILDKMYLNQKKSAPW